MGFHEKNLKQNASVNSLGFFIRYHRKKQQISMNSFADFVGITPSYLSDIEHGNKNISDYALKKIFRELKIDIQLYKENHLSFSLHNIIQSVMDFNVSNLLSYYKNLDCDFDQFSMQSSLNFNILMYYITYLFTDQTYFMIDDSTLTDVYYTLDQEHKKVMITFYAYQLERSNDNKKALELYHEVIDHYKFSKYTLMEGWIYFRIAELSLKQGYIYQSLRYCEFTDRFFKDHFHINRIILNNITKSNILSILGEYDEAICLLKSLIGHQEYGNFRNQIIQNMCSIALEHEQYQDLLEYVTYTDDTSLNMVFYEVYGRIQTGDYQKAKKKLNESIYREEKENDLIKSMLVLCEHYLTFNDFNNQDIKVLKDMKSKESNFQNKRFINRLLIDYYVKIGDFKSVYYETIKK